jgi:hypothetical protein
VLHPLSKSLAHLFFLKYVIPNGPIVNFGYAAIYNSAYVSGRHEHRFSRRCRSDIVLDLLNLSGRRIIHDEDSLTPRQHPSRLSLGNKITRHGQRISTCSSCMRRHVYKYSSIVPSELMIIHRNSIALCLHFQLPSYLANQVIYIDRRQTLF